MKLTPRHVSAQFGFYRNMKLKVTSCLYIRIYIYIYIYMWQFQVEIEQYSIAYFNHITISKCSNAELPFSAGQYQKYTVTIY